MDDICFNNLKISQLYNPLAAEKMDFDQLQPVKFLCERLNLKTRTLNTIIASGNSGKTWLIDYLAVCAANGYKFLDKYEIQKGNVLIIDQEQSAEQTFIRLQRIANGLNGDVYGVYRSELPKFEDFKGDNFKSEIKRFIKEFGFQYVFIDSLRRITNADENTSEISKILEVLKQITKEEDVCIVVIHHEGKSTGDIKQNGRGHSTIFDVPDCQINLNYSKKNGYRLKCGKIRDGICFDDICYNFKDVGEYNHNIAKTKEIVFFEIENLKNDEELSLEDAIIKLLKSDSRQFNSTEIKRGTTGDDNEKVKELDRLVAENKIKRKTGAKNAKLYWIEK